ncbi:NADH-quinone oxidoreductase subunit M [Rhodococcus antarcticus]|uniref:NADH-quinone oxidoreductase subunit M n=1 Tax=Rhodococcus antarcticus TaxID=2987751 RepID=A0ABY6P1B9_9NOCA|nr:NADH-quinone oxidoreductase subunit M [Rhodococcus antarcticus]UZJ25279.1 NADH-quinone oxidoreductase subunit M [Rhodococcus antarcticus]
MSALLLVLLLLPLAGALVAAGVGRGAGETAAKGVAVGISILELVGVAVLWAQYSTADAVNGVRLQGTLSVDWIPTFGAHFALGVDGIALVMVALVGLLVPIVLGYSWAPGTTEGELPAGRSSAGFFALVLVLESAMVGVFLATDVFLFYVFFEVMLVPMYFLIGRFGGPRRQYAAIKFFLYSLLGGLVMLAAVIGLYVSGSKARGALGGTFDWRELVAVAPQIPHSTQVWLFLGFFLAFAIKAPLVPLHTWLPDSGAEAPIGAGVLLVGVLDKVGTYGFLRYCLPLFPDASRTLAPLVLVMAVVGVLYGALLAVGQTDMKRFVAYTSIAHFGFIALGVFAFTTQSGTGAVLYMVNHGIATALLLLVVGMIIKRGGSRRFRDYRGMARSTPVLAGLFLLAGLSALALPGTNSFVSEFLVLLGSYPTQPVYAILATSGIVLAALYVLWMYQRVMQGPEGGDAVVAAKAQGRLVDVTRLEVAVLAPLVALTLLLGFYPKPVLDVITPSVTATLTELGAPASDPVPATAEEGTR